MVSAYLNKIVTAVPVFDVHKKFIQYCPVLLSDHKSRILFRRMAQRAQIDHRYSVLQPHPDNDCLDIENFYARSGFPDTGQRMQRYEQGAFPLARQALDRMSLGNVTHMIVTSCTGFYAPGLDLQVIQHYGLSPTVERTMVGFMGCYAALNALKMARHIVRSEPDAEVLILNLELCTLHLQQNGSLEEMLSFLIFADGCAASIVSSRPAGLELQTFNSTVLPSTGDQITWRIGGLGFDMHLSGKVPASIASGLTGGMASILCGHPKVNIRHWAIHPGGRSILDAVQDGAGLDDTQMAVSREILRRYGNMSSPTIMFVLNELMQNPDCGGTGCAMAFGPGLTVESMCFKVHAA